MASIASVDKTLSRVSLWMSSVAFAGMLALAFLPGREVPAPVKIAVPTFAARTCTSGQNGRAASRACSRSGRHPTVFDRRHGTSDSARSPARPQSPPRHPFRPPAQPLQRELLRAAGAAATPPAITTPPPPDVWTPEELAAGLRQCVQLLAPVTADVAMEEPMKHGQCGTPAPLALRSAGGKDKVEFAPAPTMNCRLAASMGEWVDKVLQPAAQEVLGSRITRILGSGSYSCRNIYNNPKLTLSEHATGNAIDVAAFVTADGRTITVKQGWGPTERDIVAAKKKAAEKLAAKKAGKPIAAATAADGADAVDCRSRQEGARPSRRAGSRRRTSSRTVISLPWSPVPTCSRRRPRKRPSSSACTGVPARCLRRCWVRRPTRPTATTSISI